MNSEFRSKVKNQTYGYMLGALGFVAGLAWNDAIKSLIESFFPLSNSSLWLKFLYAILVTFIVVIIGQYILRMPEENK